MTIYRLLRKTFSQWDEADNLKKMKDSQILAEDKKRVGYRKVGKGAGYGAAIGGTLGTVAGGALSLATSKGRNWKGALAGIPGAFVGAGIGGTIGAARRQKEADEAAFYNRRLKQAKKQALRREQMDWRSNISQRDGYSY